MIRIQKKPEPATPVISDIRLKGDRLFLRPPILGDWQQWRDVRECNREDLYEYEPLWPEGCLDRTFFQKRLARQAKDWHEDRCYSFMVFDFSGNLIGGANINNVVRGAAYFASIGYWLDREKRGQGLMEEALILLLGFAFRDLELHRINASALPDNEKSVNLLTRLGFREEGYAEKYLKIAGRWQDHRLFGLCAEDWQGAACGSEQENQPPA